MQHICVCTWVHIVPSDTRNETSTIHIHTHTRFICKDIFILQSKLQSQETAYSKLKEA